MKTIARFFALTGFAVIVLLFARNKAPMPVPAALVSRIANISSAEFARVMRVIDGDTIEVRLGSSTERVRYIGMDAPETVDPEKSVQCFGPEASERNKNL